MAHEDRLIHQNTDGNGILDFQNASFFNFCNIAVGPLNSKSFNLGKLISPLDVPANHEKPSTIDTYDHINGEDVLVSSENIFSPRDKNGIYDRLKLNVSVDEDTSWSIKVGLPNMLSDALPIGITGIGSDSVEWDGHLNGICMLDGQFEVFVVDNNNEILQRETFYIDNTPPVLNSYNIIERVIQPETLTQEEIIENDVTLKVMDVPYLNQQAAGITDVNSLNLVVNAEMDGLKIRDPLDFQILGKTNEEFTLDFTVDGRLSSRFLHVSFQDDVGNTQSLDLNQP